MRVADYFGSEMNKDGGADPGVVLKKLKKQMGGGPKRKRRRLADLPSPSKLTLVIKNPTKNTNRDRPGLGQRPTFVQKLKDLWGSLSFICYVVLSPEVVSRDRRNPSQC